MSVFCGLIMIEFGQVNDIYISMEGGKDMPPKKRFTPEDVERAWEEHKRKCDEHTVVRTEFSQKLGEFVTQTVPSPISYTKLGLLCDLNISKQAFHDDYENDPAFADLVSRIAKECEQDVRRKFEDKSIPSQLSGLWMSQFGYTVKNEQEIKGNVPVVIAGEDDLSE